MIKQELTQEQKTALSMIETLRARKEILKDSIGKLNNEVVELDIQIRDIRQSIPSLAPPQQETKLKKQKKSNEELKQELLRQLEDITNKLKEFDSNGNN